MTTFKNINKTFLRLCSKIWFGHVPFSPYFLALLVSNSISNSINSSISMILNVTTRSYISKLQAAKWQIKKVKLPRKKSFLRPLGKARCQNLENFCNRVTSFLSFDILDIFFVLMQLKNPFLVRALGVSFLEDTILAEAQTIFSHQPLNTWAGNLETVDENLVLTAWFINQKGSLLVSNVKLEVKIDIQELQNEVLYVSVTQIS